MQSLLSYFNDPRFIPHGFCLLWRPDVLALQVISDGLIAAAYFSIPLAILWFVRRRHDLISEHKRIAILFSVFILGCGLTHVLDIVVLWRPVYVVDGWVKAFTAIASIVTAAALWPMLPRLLEIPSPGQLARANALLQDEVSARRQALEELEANRFNLETEIARRVSEMQVLTRRFELATADSVVNVSEQDDQLRYTWMHNSQRGLSVVGMTDEEAFGPAAAAVLTPLKRHVLQTGEPLRTKAVVPVDGVDYHYQLKISPAQVPGAGAGLLITAVDVSEQEGQKEHLQVIMRELAHRAKNLLSLVEGIARQTAKAEGLPPSFIQRFAKRLSALGAAHDLLITQDWRGLNLADLVAKQLAHALPDAPDRISIAGPQLIVRPEVGQYLALALHELATNATKYGVLSQTGGCLDVRWRVLENADGPGLIEMTWTEQGAVVIAPSRSGFGRQLLQTIVPRALGGEAWLDFTPNGVRWRASFAR